MLKAFCVTDGTRFEVDEGEIDLLVISEQTVLIVAYLSSSLSIG